MNSNSELSWITGDLTGVWKLLAHLGMPSPTLTLELGAESFYNWIRVAWVLVPGQVTYKWGSVQFSCSVASDSMTPWTAACQASLPITKYQSLLKLMSVESVMPSNYLILCHPLLFLPSVFVFFFPQHQGLFHWVSSLYHVAKVLELQLQHQFFQWIVGSISFRTDWFNLFAVQGSPPPQFKSINSLVLSFLYGPTLTSIHDYWKNYRFD